MPEIIIPVAPTSNVVPSSDARDQLYNAYQLDIAANGGIDDTWKNRLGEEKHTIAYTQYQNALLEAKLTDPVHGAHMVTYKNAATGGVSRQLQDVLDDGVRSKDFDTLDHAISKVGITGQKINLAGTTITQSAALWNPYGVILDGGKVLVPSLISGKYDQINTYSDNARVMLHPESLAAFRLACAAGTPSTIFIFGDSTVSMNDGYIPKSDGLVKYALYQAGIGLVNTSNQGVSGTSWSDLNAIPLLGESTKLIVIKFGINDAEKTNPLVTLANDARSKLTGIRAATYGTYANLSILLMGPSSTYRPSNGQDSKWYEDVRNIYVQLAKEFDCAYFDTYAWLQNTRHAPGMWLDDFTSLEQPGEGLHPLPDPAWWIWYEGFKQHVFGDGCWNRLKTNNYWNRNGTDPGFTALAADHPQSYPFGLVIDRATTAAGWPALGTVVTIRAAGGATGGEVRQELTTLDTVPRKYFRTGITTGWTQWTGLTTPLTLVNSWLNKNTTNTPASYATVSFDVDSDGWVNVHGAMTAGTLNGVFSTMPSNARAGRLKAFNVVGGNASAGTPAASATIYLRANGDMEVYASSNGTIVLDGIRFKAGE